MYWNGREDENTTLMKKKVPIMLLFLMTCTVLQAQFYDFSAVSPSGHRLYYSILPGGVEVSPPGYDEHNPWQGYEKPSGDLVIPSTVRYGDTVYSVIELHSHCFLECNDLRSVVLPSTLKVIGVYAMAGCRGLKGLLTVPEGVEHVGNYAFCCSGMSAMQLPTTLRTIGYSAFQDCEHLAYIEVPDGVEHIGEKAFLYIPQVVYSGRATGAPWGAAVYNGKATASWLRALLPHSTVHGDSGTD